METLGHELFTLPRRCCSERWRARAGRVPNGLCQAELKMTPDSCALRQASAQGEGSTTPTDALRKSF